MNMTSLKLIYFSPTHTTRQVLMGITHGLMPADVRHLDLTPPDAEMKKALISSNDLVLIGSPVYSGRIPGIVISRLRKLHGNGALAVIVVVYGNRAYDDALLELRDIAMAVGFRVIAAGAFIGEHSYSTAESPIASGRPDAEDLAQARVFGQSVSSKLLYLRDLGKMPPLEVPGEFPLKESGQLSSISPEVDESLCNRCLKCSFVCPTAAIATNATLMASQSLCIRCCACVKSCPVGARAMKDPRIKQVAMKLSESCSPRRLPETFL